MRNSGGSKEWVKVGSFRHAHIVTTAGPPPKPRRNKMIDKCAVCGDTKEIEVCLAIANWTKNERGEEEYDPLPHPVCYECMILEYEASVLH